MANVICRAELHGSPTSEQYKEFHAGMSEFGLERTITRDGKVFHLPTGEYLGVNLSASFNLLALKITGLAIQTTGRQCKLTLTPVSDPATIYISGLDEEVSYASELGAFAASHPHPTYSGFSALAELASKPTSGFSALAELASKSTLPASLFGSFPGSKS